MKLQVIDFKSLLILCMALFVLGFVYCATNWSQFDFVSKKSCTMAQLTPPEIWKWHAVLLGVHTVCSNTKISLCLGVNQKAVQKIQKELEESNGDYDDMAAQKPHSDCSDKKELPNLLVKFNL